MNCTNFRAAYPVFAGELSPDVWESREFSGWADHGRHCLECQEWSQRQELAARGEDESRFPCVHLAYHATMTCDVHKDAWECADMTLVRTRAGFGIPVRDRGRSAIEIAFCPWCGRAI